MSLINISNLTFCYEGSYDNIFENVSLQIDTDWKLGFIGRNGRGKTTFMNLLQGKYEYSGTISSSVSFEYFPYIIEDKTRPTIDILNEISSDYMLWEIECELSKLNVSSDVLYRPFDTLSNGEQTKVLLAALFLKTNSFLLIDEPTNHLDYEAREIVVKYLNSKKGFILVSHDRMFLDSCVDHILSINKTNIELQSGNFSSWYYNKQLQDKYELDKNHRLKKDIKRLERAARQTAGWANKVEKSKIGNHAADRGYIGHKAAKMMKRSKAIEERKVRQIEEKAGLLKNIEEQEDLKIHPLSYHTQKMMSFDKISLFYGDRLICSDITFDISEGDRVALRGKNGSGKSSIIKLICDEDIKYTGNLYKGSNLKISYVSQDTSFLWGNLTHYAMENLIDESLFKAILRKLGFSRIQFEKNMEDFSAGQRKKVLLARSLCERAHFYIWDEPLNYIDIFSRMQLEELILQYKPTLLFVEHDKVFCEKIATKIVEL